ncbi:MAG: nitroreductase family protein [Candidatus ainarchaeum sp.]|nr:nitroreductase family protein [Candidatus ainarchaeum sp.]
MDFYDVIDKRRSVRAFQDKPVDAKVLRKILDTVSLAPSAGNLQAYKITIVRKQELKEGLMSAAFDQESIINAPVVLVFSADEKRSETKYGDRGLEFYSLQDATIAAAYCQLVAAAEGLGSVWVGGFDALEVSRLINAESYEVPVAIIPLGYPAENPGRRERRHLKELVREM